MRKKVLGLVIRIVVSAGIIAYIFTRPDTSFSVIVATIRNMNISWFIGALLVYPIAILLSSCRWQMLMKAQNIEVSYLRSLGLNYLGCFFNNFMLSLTGGDVVKAYYATKLTEAKKTEVVTIVFVDRLLGIGGLTVMGIVSSLFVLGNAKMHLAVIVIMCVVFLFLIIGILAFNKTLVKKLGKRVSHFKLMEVLKKIYDAVYFYKSRKKVLVAALMLSVVIWTCLISINLLLARGLDVKLSPGHFFVFIPAINIISSIPITLAGWGLREEMYQQFFETVGIQGKVAVSLSISYAATMILWSLVGGVLYALRLPRLNIQKEKETGKVSPLLKGKIY